jgi:hypothetical protein
VLTIRADGVPEEEVRTMLLASRYHVIASGVIYDRSQNNRELTCELGWRAFPADSEVPSVLQALEQLAGVTKLQWQPQGLPHGNLE